MPAGTLVQFHQYDAYDGNEGYTFGHWATPDVSCRVHGLRLRLGKTTGIVGSVVGSIWSQAGVRLATGTVSGIAINGTTEIDITFVAPVDLIGGTTYTFSCYADHANYRCNNADPASHAHAAAGVSFTVVQNKFEAGDAFPNQQGSNWAIENSPFIEVVSGRKNQMII